MPDQQDEREIRIFISSPSDVAAERERAGAVLRELAPEFQGRFKLTPILWEESYYSAHQTFQQAIPKPSSCQLVVCILWKRLGTELPPGFNRPDSSTRTGTEYEFEEALEAALVQNIPDILVYRKRLLVDADRLGQEASELKALNAFWQRWFSDEDANFTASFDRFDTTEEFHDRLKRDVRQWLARQTDDVTWPIESLGSPFRSLEPFGLDHARVFFGRRRAIRQAAAKLAAAAARGCPFLLVLGGSGTGKSSLVRAGILPFLTLEKGLPGIDQWRMASVRPAALGLDLLSGLAAALVQPGALPEIAGAVATLAALMASAPTKTAERIASALQNLADTGGAARLVLLVDQLEELLLRPAAEREQLIAVLGALARSDRVWVIATLRNDRYAELQAAPGLVKLKEDGDSLDLLPPGPAEIREIIAGPARAAGIRFEDTGERDLALSLETAAEERGALPLLQFTLQCLFEERDTANGTLLLSVYDRLGGLAGAIAVEADRLVTDLTETARAALPSLLLKLVEIEESKEAASARTIARAAVTDPAERDVAQKLIAARLLTVDGDGDGGEARLRLAHEALLTRWPLLAGLVAEQRDYLQTRQRLEADAATWAANDRHADFLLPSGRRLAASAEAIASHRAELPAAAIDLVEASLAAERLRLEAEAEAARRELELRAATAEANEQSARRLVRRTRIAIAVVSAMLLVMVGASALWLDQRREAQRHAAEAEASYTTALNAAMENLDILERAVSAGRATYPVKTALLNITRDAFGDLQSDAETPDATAARAHLFILLGSLGGESAVASARKAVHLAQDLADKDPTDIKRKDLLQQAHYQLGMMLILAGHLPDAAKQLTDAESVALAVWTAHPDDKRWSQLVNIDRKSVADLMQRQGNFSGAYDRYKTIDDRIGQGDVLLVHGKLAEAAQLYRDNLETVLDNVKKIGAYANANIEVVQAAGRLKVGDAFRIEGKFAKAREEYESAAKLTKLMVENKTGSFRAAVVQYSAERGIADMAFAQHDLDDAKSRYDQMAETVIERETKNSEIPEWQAQLLEIDERLGDISLTKGAFGDAESQYRTELGIAQKLVQTVDGEADWRRDVVLAHGRLGMALRGKGDLAGASAEFKTASELADKLLKVDPDNANWRRDLAIALAGLGAAEEDRHDAAAAGNAFGRCAKIALTTPTDPRDELAYDPRPVCIAKSK